MPHLRLPCGIPFYTVAFCPGEMRSENFPESTKWEKSTVEVIGRVDKIDASVLQRGCFFEALRNLGLQAAIPENSVAAADVKRVFGEINIFCTDAGAGASAGFS